MQVTCEALGLGRVIKCRPVPPPSGNEAEGLLSKRRRLTGYSGHSGRALRLSASRSDFLTSLTR